MDPIAPAPPPLQDDMGDETLEELGMTAEEDDEDRTTLDDDSSKEGSTELLSSPQAAKKRAAQTDAIKVNLFIARIYKKVHNATLPNPSNRNT